MSSFTPILNHVVPILLPLAIVLMQWWRWRDAKARGLTAEQFKLVETSASENLRRRAESHRVTAWLLIALPIVGMAMPLIRYQNFMLTLIIVTALLETVFGFWGWSMLRRARALEERAREVPMKKS